MRWAIGIVVVDVADRRARDDDEIVLCIVVRNERGWGADADVGVPFAGWSQIYGRYSLVDRQITIHAPAFEDLLPAFVPAWHLCDAPSDILQYVKGIIRREGRCTVRKKVSGGKICSDNASTHRSSSTGPTARATPESTMFTTLR